MVVSCLSGGSRSESVAGKGKVSTAGISVWSVGLQVRGKEELKGTSLVDAGGWDDEVKDAAEVVWSYDGEVGGSESDVWKTRK